VGAGGGGGGGGAPGGGGGGGAPAPTALQAAVAACACHPSVAAAQCHGGSPVSLPPPVPPTSPASSTPAGNWADARVAVSGTGIGEEFIRRAACHDVAARMAYGGAGLEQAAHGLVFDSMRPNDGGIVAVDAEYHIAMPFNSPGMYRAAADSSGRFEAAIFREGTAGAGACDARVGGPSEPAGGAGAVDSLTGDRGTRSNH